MPVNLDSAWSFLFQQKKKPRDCSCFCSLRPARLADYAEYENGGTLLRGQPALMAQWARLSDSPSFKDLSVFQQFRHWLPLEQQRMLDRLTQAALQTELVMPAKAHEPDRRTRKSGKVKPPSGACSSRTL